MPKTLSSTSKLTERYTLEFANSRRLHEQACTLFPNGVTHDLRHLEPFPIYIDKAAGAHKWDVDGHRLIDFWAGHGALLLGHGRPEIVKAVQEQMTRATHPGACHELEIEWARWVKKLVPSAEKLRFVSSGTEATLMALRLARIHTGKPRVLKFAGHFHGWHDAVMPAAYAANEAGGVPGVPTSVQADVVVVPPNDLIAIERALGNDPTIGCVILEPTGGHFGAVPIAGPFLHGLRDLTRKMNRLLIFDEVITGFRVHPGGAQGYYGVLPDLTTLAKILAGGLPGGCVAGRADIMEAIEFRPGKVKMRHPGTFNANPLSATAGIAALRIVAGTDACERANRLGQLLRRRLNESFQRSELNWAAYGEFSGFKLLPGYGGPWPMSDDFIPYDGDFERLETPTPTSLVHRFRQAALLNGVDLPGLGGMTMAAHEESDIEVSVEAIGKSIRMIEA